MMPAASGAATAEAVRVMIVDDSVVVRGLVARWIGEEPGFEVVGTCRTGKAAVDEIARLRPHVVTLDIEMPDMDGLTALPLLLKAQPGVSIVMASTLTQRNADVTLKCLARGATDFVTKPTQDVAQAEYRRDLVAKVRALGEAAIRRQKAAFGPTRAALRPAFAAAPGPTAAASRRVAFAPAQPPAVAPSHGAPALKPLSITPVRALAIGSSTGGPQALAAVLRAAGPSLARIPVVITQHMPPTFTAALAEHLGAASGRPAREASDGEPIVPGTIYVAPGGKHFAVRVRAGGAHAVILDGPPENFCKPSVDPMFKGAAEAYGAGLLAVILTGMGSDGAGGVRAVAAAGGSILAQDEATSVVWGMPGAAAATGCCSAILSLPAIGPKIVRLIAGERA